MNVRIYTVIYSLLTVLYECDHCKQEFATPFDFFSHKKIHSETLVKPYICDICKKAFAHSSYLTRHKRIHTAKKL